MKSDGTLEVCTFSGLTRLKPSLDFVGEHDRDFRERVDFIGKKNLLQVLRRFLPVGHFVKLIQ